MLLAAVLLCWGLEAAGALCPEHVAPCDCRDVKDDAGQTFSVLSCRGLLSDIPLRAALKAVRGADIFELELRHCALERLPHDAFPGTRFQVISVHHCCFSQPDHSAVAFPGLETTLELIDYANCSFASPWDWSRLGHLDNLMEVQLSNSAQIRATEGVAGIAQLPIGSLGFQKNGIVELEDEAFASFHEIHRLSLDNNRIRVVKRSMFPRPAPNLKIIGLSQNDINQLPEDIFADMPSLKSLYLTANPMHTIDEAVFGPVWSQLHLLLLHASPLCCDCQLSWLLEKDNTDKFIHADCYYPQQLRGRHLLDLHPQEIPC